MSASHNGGIDFAGIIEPVARHLLGQPNKELSNKRQLRFGSNGSISVEISGDNKGQWFDHEAGEGGGVLDLVRVKKHLIDGDAFRWLEEHRFIPKKENQSGGSKIVATYDYRDANGKLLFQVVRFEPKTFRQRRPNGRGGWTWKLDDVERVLYRLPELLAAQPTTTVYLAEGEKDVDALRQQMLVATCNPGGAESSGASKWTPSMSVYLRDRHVVILPDNDGAGEKHANAVARSLKGKAKSVRIVRLPNLPDKGDVSDWLNAGGTAEQLEHLVSDAPDPEPEQSLDAEWWLTRELEKPKPLLGEVLMSTTRLLLGGPTGIGKTHLALAMAAGIATGIGFCNWRSPIGGEPVIYLDDEMARDLIQERLHDLKRRIGGIDLSKLIVICREDFPDMEALNTESGQEFILDTVQHYSAAAIFLDNRMCLLAGDMKEEQPWTDTMPFVRELTRQRVAQCWIDHTGHDTGKTYGTKTKEWQQDTVAMLAKAERPGTDIAFQLEFTKARRRTPETRQDFETTIFALENDRWTSEPLSRDTCKFGNVPPSREPFYDALVAAIGKSAVGAGKTTLPTWELECLRRGLIHRALELGKNEKETWQQKDKRYADYRKAKSVLIAAKWIAVDGDLVIDLKARWS